MHLPLPHPDVTPPVTGRALQCRSCGATFDQPLGRPAVDCPDCRRAAGVEVRHRACQPPTVEQTSALAATVAGQRAAIELAKACLRTGRVAEALDVLDRVGTVADATLIPEPRTSPAESTL